MTRRAVAGLVQLIPLLLIAGAVVIIAGAILLAACGASSDTAQTGTTPASPGGTAEASSSPSPSASPATTTVRLYYVRDDELGVAERRLPRTSAIATATLRALFNGPTPTERDADLSTSLAASVKVNALTIENGLAELDLSSAFARSTDDLDDAHRLLPVAQVVFTLTQFPTVKRVAIRVDGKSYAPPGSTATSSTEWRRRDFLDFEPGIFVESPGAGAIVSSPFVLSGTASVYEGSFRARLVDSSGRRIVEVVMQASRGAPERGAFTKEIAFSTSAKAGTLIVFDQSMEDGSRQDEVRIPVTFATD